MRHHMQQVYKPAQSECDFFFRAQRSRETSVHHVPSWCSFLGHLSLKSFEAPRMKWVGSFSSSLLCGQTLCAHKQNPALFFVGFSQLCSIWNYVERLITSRRYPGVHDRPWILCQVFSTNVCSCVSTRRAHTPTTDWRTEMKYYVPLWLSSLHFCALRPCFLSSLPSGTFLAS